MTSLSPQAQAVLDASNLLPGKDSYLILAAALRAAADQVVPKDKYPSSDWTDKDEVRYQLLAIAAELDNSP
jgi:hypothetical protein